MADTPTNVNVLSLFGSIGLDSSEFNKGLDEAARKMSEFGQSLTNNVTQATTNANNALNGVTTTATTGATAMNGITDAAEAAGNAINELGDSTQSTTTIIDGARRTTEGLGEEIDKTTNAEQDYNEETQDAKKKTDDFGSSMDKTSERAGRLQAALSKGVSVAVKAIGAAMAAAATAATALVKQSVDAYGNYEQLVGGVQTLFSNLEGTVSAAPTVLENAANAYKTAGMSANQYMETVTSFSAALVAGLEGDYQKAAEVSDMAIRDMSDNMNKMGSSMQSIQNAYQGFARGNYTMLDNLKLGYSGTKTEMERLLKDAEEFSGVQYDC